MAGDPAPLAAVQAAVLKTAASKQAAQADPAQVAQSNAVAQDLSVMADQAKGYTAGVNAGTIVAQDQRASQNARLAQEAAQAAAERQRALQLEQMQTQRMQLEQQAAAQEYQRDLIRARQTQAEEAAAKRQAEQEPDVANAGIAVRHASVNRGPRFNEALSLALQNSTSSYEAVQFLKDMADAGEEWAVGIQPDVLRRYAEQYFRGLEGRAVNVNVLSKAGQSAPAPKRNPLRDFYGLDV